MCFFFNDTATTEIYTLSLHDALPICTAQAKGAAPSRIVLRHTLRGSLGPVATLVGFSIPAMVAGTIIIESVFNYQGMGLLIYQATLVQDFPVLLGTTLVVAVATVVGSVVAD